MPPGRATLDGTADYAARLAARTAPGHFRRLGNLTVSSIGIGTYLGPADDATDLSYQASVVRALELGLNVIDTASNYRHQRSERAVGRGLVEAIERGLVQREEVVIASKAGFLPFDGARPADPRTYIQHAFIDAGLLSWSDIVAGCHSLAPTYLREQIEQSRRNLGQRTVDVYYLHNPEMQLEEVPRERFLARMRDAFAELERACADDDIGCYGTATWAGYRVPPHHPGHLSMEELVRIAEQVGGAGHHFRVVQLPYNLRMPEARVMATQRVAGVQMPALDAASRLGLYVMASASIEQGKLAAHLPRGPGDNAGEHALRSSAQRALQYARSAPGMGTALVGMKTPAHVDENAAVAAVPPTTAT